MKDLKPKESKFKLDDFPDREFTLKKFNLNAQIWVSEQFGVENLKNIFEQGRMREVSEIAFFLLKERDVFKTVDELREAIASMQDRVNLFQALLETIGISQPMIDKLSREYDEEGKQAAANQTGAGIGDTPTT